MTSFLEKQYKILDENTREHGKAVFGNMSSFTWNTDPKRLLFVLSRYKFVSKMLADCGEVLEVGCGDGFGSRVVRQAVPNVSLTDFDERMVSSARELVSGVFPAEVFQHDFIAAGIEGRSFDGIYLLDVLEHILGENERRFLSNIRSNLNRGGKIVIGMPSRESQTYASPASQEGHVNCKTQEDLHRLVKDIFGVAFSFSMNDEVVHTGFSRMANYIFCVGVYCGETA